MRADDWPGTAAEPLNSSVFYDRGMTVARLAGRWPGVPQAPGVLLPYRGIAFRWSGCLWQGGDPVPGGGDGLCPGPGGGDFQPPAAAAADQLPGGVQDPVTQGLGLGAGEVAVQGDEPQPGQQGGGD